MKILIADDSADTRQLLKHLVRQRGHKAIEAANGRVALKKARSCRPDVVISDAVMPVMDGFQLLRELKTDKELRRIPFILLSALYDKPREWQLAESLGASAFLTKSMRLDEMWSHIESAMKKPAAPSEPESEPVLNDNQFNESHVQLVVSKLKEKVGQLENEIEERKKAEAKLAEAAREWATTFDAMSDGVSIHGTDFRIINANAALCRMLGKTKDEIIGHACHSVFHGLDAPIEECPMKRTMAGGKQEHVERFEPALGCWLSIATSPVFDEQGDLTHCIHVTRDISGRRQREDQLQRQLQHVSALHHIDLAITSSLDLRVTLDIILDQVATELGVDAADILLLNPHFQVLEYAAGRGFHTRALQHTHLRLGECFAGRAARERRIVSVRDLTRSPGEFVRAPQLSEEKFVSYFAAPLITKGQVKGVLELFNRTPFDADAEWLIFLETLATQAAIAIDSASLFDDLQRSHTDLMLAYDTTLEGWSRAMDLRDKETEGHTRRVSDMTLCLARALGVGDAELVHMYRGALLHDIGKIGIPDNILLKPGKLTDEEWVVMKRHPVYAYELLYPIPFLRPAIDIPYCHHETWNGKGYPRGLEGTGIPLSARIFSVIDVWDALRSDRPYRPAWPEEKVREYIISLTGIQFDPEVVKVFLEMEW